MKMPDRNNIREERFLLSRGSESGLHVAGVGWLMEVGGPAQLADILAEQEAQCKWGRAHNL